MEKDFGSTKIKITPLSGLKINKIQQFIKSHKFYNLCKKGVNRDYIQGYFKMKLEDSMDEYLIELYDKKLKEVVGFAILFVNKTITGKTYGEIMIICSNSNVKGMGAALLKYVEVWAKKVQSCKMMILCSLNTPYGFYKKMGYKIMDSERKCKITNHKYRDNFYETEEEFGLFEDQNEFVEYFQKDEINPQLIEPANCPYNPHDNCVYMYKKL